MAELTAGAQQQYSNQEELSYWSRVVLGVAPMLILIGILYGLLVWLWLYQTPRSMVLLGVIVAWSAAGLAAAVYLARLLRRRTPTQIRIGDESLTAEWGSPPRRTEQIAYEHITGFAQRRWKWISEGKANFYRFTPSLVQYRVPPVGGKDRWTRYGKNQQVLFLTDANLARARASFEAWGGVARTHSDAPLEDNS